MPHSYRYPRAALTVECVIFGYDTEDLKVLLIQRDSPPFEGRWALPGGFVYSSSIIMPEQKEEKVSCWKPMSSTIWGTCGTIGSRGAETVS